MMLLLLLLLYLLSNLTLWIYVVKWIVDCTKESTILVYGSQCMCTIYTNMLFERARALKMSTSNASPCAYWCVWMWPMYMCVVVHVSIYLFCCFCMYVDVEWLYIYLFIFFITMKQHNNFNHIYNRWHSEWYDCIGVHVNLNV